MDIRTYRKQELEKFYDSQVANMDDNPDGVTLSKVVKCKRVDMSSEEYIKSLNLHIRRDKNEVDDMNHDIESIIEILEGLRPNEWACGEVIPCHEVKGNTTLFHFDHYESTTLRITPNRLTLVDKYHKMEGDSTPDPIFKVRVKGKDNIARLIRYFNIDLDNSNILKNLYIAMASYAKEQRMDGIDLFGKLFNEIGVKFEGKFLMYKSGSRF